MAPTTILLAREALARGRERLLALGDDLDFVTLDEHGRWVGPLERTEIVLFSEGLWGPDLARTRLSEIVELPRLRWLHTETSGVDHPLFRRLLERGVILTRSRSAMSVPIAEFVLGLMLRVVKRFDHWSALQRAARWPATLSDDCDSLAGKQLVLIGLGAIGQTIARYASLLGMRVSACRRSGAPSPLASPVVPPNRLAEILPASDFVVAIVPATSETRGWLGAAKFRAMSRRTWFINVGRGETVDTGALLAALQERWIAGACLDVFAEEPLPATHALWARDDVIISPHISATSPRFCEAVIDLFIGGLVAYREGRRPPDEVSLETLGVCGANDHA